MTTASEDHDFIENTFPKFEGWCMPEAAYLTCHLMDGQKDVPGVALEIGVYKGKYFSILCHKARRYRRHAVGIDIFIYAPQEGVRNQLAEEFPGMANISLVEQDSKELAAGDLLALMGSQQAAFVSVDGDHSPGGVHHDLVLAAETLAPGGVVAIDDFLNARAIGERRGEPVLPVASLQAAAVCLFSQ
jgi:hypothetical protein